MVAVMMFAVDVVGRSDAHAALSRAAGCGVGHWDHGRARRVCVGDSWRERPRVGACRRSAQRYGALSLLWAGVLDLQASGTLGVTSQSDWPCVASMTVGGLVVGAPLVWMLRRGAPLTPGLTAFLAGVGRAERRQYRSVPDAPSCVRTDGPPVAWRTIVAAAAGAAMIVRRSWRWPALMR